MDHTTQGGAPLTTTSPTQNPQSPETTVPPESVESSGRRFLARALSAPTNAIRRNGARRTQTHPGGPPYGKLSLPFHPTAHPKEKLPPGFPVPSFERMFTGLLEAPRPVGDAPSVLNQLRNIATYSWLNLLLVFIPISWAVVSDFPLILSAACGPSPQHLSYSLGLTLSPSPLVPRSHGAAPYSNKPFITPRLSEQPQPPLWPHCDPHPLLTFACLVSYV